MHVEDVRKYCLGLKGVTESFPFDKSTLVFKVQNKIFALTGLDKHPFQINLKCDPDRAIALREEYDGAIIPGYHMSKVHWNTVFAESIPESFLLELINHSYELIVKSLSKKLQEELQNI